RRRRLLRRRTALLSASLRVLRALTAARRRAAALAALRRPAAILPLLSAALLPLRSALLARRRRRPVAARWWPFAARRRRFALRRLAFGSRLDHRQRHAAPLLVHRHHPHVDHVADRHHVIRTLDVAVRHLADVDETAILQADVDERPEIDDVQHRPLQLHA